jgi:ribosomal protein S18 acetylase RimI-like enzyme
MNALVIRPLQSAAEARHCAGFLAASDPWRTLGLNADQILRRLTGSARETYVAAVENQIVGVLVLQLAGPFNGYIQIVATHPDWRGRGLGTRLMQFAEERIFRQSPNVFLCVTAFNRRAREFYARRGYERVGELPDFLVNGFSEILLRKTNGPLLDFAPRAQD